MNEETTNVDRIARRGELADLYRTALVKDVIPFWMRHSPDPEFGGYLTCIDAQGAVYDTDKFAWMQARQVWMFAHLYNTLETRQEWLEHARIGAAFLSRYGRDPEGSFYYAFTREGRPLAHAWNIFSDGFAAMAFGEYSLASGDIEAEKIALSAYRRFVARKASPKGVFSKAVPGTRPMENMGIRMMHLNLLLVMEPILGETETRQTAQMLVDDVLGRFLDSERNLLFENVAPDGSHPDTFDGRCINPGHGMEVLWMLLATARRWKWTEIHTPVANAMCSTLAYGWDDVYNGLFYRRDALGKPSLNIEWDQKMWWVFAESLLALSMAYAMTGRDDLFAWLERMHDYTWSHFPDPEHGEWWGYLNRRGEVLLPTKGGRWKGCFHVPRALLMASRELKPGECG